MALQPKRRSLIWLHFLPKFSFTTPPPLPHTVFENGQNRLVLQIYEGNVLLENLESFHPKKIREDCKNSFHKRHLTIFRWKLMGRYQPIFRQCDHPDVCCFGGFFLRFLNFHREEFSLLQCWVILLSTYVFCCLGPLCFEVSVVWGGVAPSSLEKSKQEFMISLVCNL
mgnify:CR=1 FL=1